MAPRRTFREMETHWARYFWTARKTGNNPGHQSLEQDYHMERRWHLVGTGRPSCRAGYFFAGRWPTWRQSHNGTCKRSCGESQKEEATQYGSVAMRAAYLAQDRPDLQVATRSLAQGLQRSTTSHMLTLKRVARYLRYRPRMAQFFRHQSKLSPFVMWSDADMMLITLVAWRRARVCHEAYLWLEDVASRVIRRDKVLSHSRLERANTMPLLAALAVC